VGWRVRSQEDRNKVEEATIERYACVSGMERKGKTTRQGKNEFVDGDNK